jgi:hypothetical protein
MRWLALAAAADQITVIVTESLLFAPLRERIARRSHYLGELVSCFLCFGTWTGLALALLGGGPYRAAVRKRRGPLGALVAWAIDGFAIAFTARLLNEFTGKLQREVKVLDETAEQLEREAEQTAPRGLEAWSNR